MENATGAVAIPELWVAHISLLLNCVDDEESRIIVDVLLASNISTGITIQFQPVDVKDAVKHLSK